MRLLLLLPPLLLLLDWASSACTLSSNKLLQHAASNKMNAAVKQLVWSSHISS
jgi:hypothetical protein